MFSSEIKMQFDYTGPEINDIRRCLNMLFSTKAGTVPLDREFGLDCDFTDMPAMVAENEFALEVITKTMKYEPRVKVAQVTFDHDASGKVIPKVHLTKGAG